MKSVYVKFLNIFALTALLLLLAGAVLVLVFDPFYHYHGPVLGLKSVVTKSEYQCIGTIRHFDYDSVMAGSSTAENYNNHWFDQAFGCTTVKAIKSSGTTADLKYYLDEAFATHQIKNVFYSLDPFSLDGDPDNNFVNENMPLYLFDTNLLNDVKYLLNKDVLFEDIPYLLAVNFLEDHDEGTSYNWAQSKTFSKEGTLSHYYRTEEILEMIPAEEYQQRVDDNIALLEEQLQAHPETTWYFFIPPYSMLWWDNAYRTGEMEKYRYLLETSMEVLAAYDNARVYNFMHEEEIVLDLDKYMDLIHFSQQINYYLVEQAAADNSLYRVTADNYRVHLEKIDAITEKILKEEMPALFEKQEGAQ